MPPISAKISSLFRLTRFALAIGLIFVGLLTPLSCTTTPVPTSAEIAAAVPVNLGFSNRPSWLLWEVARHKQFFEQNRANVALKWFDRYADSLGAFHSQLLDANTQTLADTIRAISAGEDWAIVLVTDATDSTIPDFGHLAVTRQQIEERPDAIQGLVNTWFDSVEYIRQQPEKADRIMAKRVNLAPENYRSLATDTTPFGIAENFNAFAPGNDTTHLPNAAQATVQRLLNNGAIQAKPDLTQLLDDRFIQAYAASRNTTIEQ